MKGDVGMERVCDVAQYIYTKYKNLSGQEIDEMKLHKLLYFSQRESIAVIGEPMFDAEFEAWKYGPVCTTVRSAFSARGINADCSDISFDNAYMINNVINEYGKFESWELSNISHKEISWKNSRKGYENDEICKNTLKLSDIREDAKKIRPYDHVWDMYYDEFEDVE